MNHFYNSLEKSLEEVKNGLIQIENSKVSLDKEIEDLKLRLNVDISIQDDIIKDATARIEQAKLTKSQLSSECDKVLNDLNIRKEMTVAPSEELLDAEKKYERIIQNFFQLRKEFEEVNIASTLASIRSIPKKSVDDENTTVHDESTIPENVDGADDTVDNSVAVVNTDGFDFVDDEHSVDEEPTKVGKKRSRRATLRDSYIVGQELENYPDDFNFTNELDDLSKRFTKRK